MTLGQHAQGRHFLKKLLLTAALGLCIMAAGAIVRPSAALAKGPVVEVWKSPTCGCCNDWITHLKANGFQVTAYDKGNNAIRQALGMPVKYGSCHTAKVAGYVIEGHVPAREIKRLLEERPKALGLSVPQMPIGTPGMDGPEYGGQVDPYEVLLVGHGGAASVYKAYTLKRASK